MSTKTLFVGAGAMGGAILRGALEARVLRVEDVHVVEHGEATCARLQQELGVTATTTVPDLSDFGLLLFAVKPQVLRTVLTQYVNVSQETVLLSVAAGVTLETLQEAIPSRNWLRAMPNTPLAVKAGFTAIAAAPEGDGVPSIVMQLFESLGRVVTVSEDHLERLGALSGVGPGFAFVIMDALADAGVQIGLPRALALEAACQTLAGAGALAVATGTHPSLLRDQVTSPGGTTIAGITAFEAHGGRSALHEAVKASYSRSLELGARKGKD